MCVKTINNILTSVALAGKRTRNGRLQASEGRRRLKTALHPGGGPARPSLIGLPWCQDSRTESGMSSRGRLSLEHVCQSRWRGSWEVTKSLGGLNLCLLSAR